MDSITHIALGAALGEYVAGKKAGNKAILWGAIACTIPDFDVFFLPLYSEVDKLAIHRGFSHSLIFPFLIAPLLGWILSKLYRSKSDMTVKDWTLLLFSGLFIHPILDAFTTYGTQWFLPFSNYRVAFNVIAVVDPFYSVSLIAGVIGVMVLRRKNYQKGYKWNRAGLIISSFYFCFALFNKYRLEQLFKTSMEQQHIVPKQYMTNPVLFSNFLWYCVAKDDSSCHIGYYSLFQKNKTVQFETYKINAGLLNKIADQKGANQLKWFTKDYFLLEERNDTLCFFDIRFGKSEFNTSTDYEQSFVFFYKIPHPENRPLEIQQYISKENMDFGKFMSKISYRIKQD